MAVQSKEVINYLLMMLDELHPFEGKTDSYFSCRLKIKIKNIYKFKDVYNDTEVYI